MDDFRWRDVEAALERVCSLGGFLKIMIVGADRVLVRDLSLTAERGAFLVGMFDQSGDEDDEVRSLDIGKRGEGVWFAGNQWDSSELTVDRSIVFRCFAEFVAKGDVSRELLS